MIYFKFRKQAFFLTIAVTFFAFGFSVCYFLALKQSPEITFKENKTNNKSSNEQINALIALEIAQSELQRKKIVLWNDYKIIIASDVEKKDWCVSFIAKPVEVGNELMIFIKSRDDIQVHHGF
jgi:hypothetical protein